MMNIAIPAKLISRHRDTDNATVLRGLAAVSVVIVHYDGFGIRKMFKDDSSMSFLVNTFVSLGIYGPPVFFVASGFALSASLANRQTKIATFAIQRFFRMWPLYAVVFLLGITFKATINGKIGSIEVKNIFMHLTFLDVFNWKYLKSDPIGVLSSVPIEFWWSLLIPGLILARQKSKYIEIPMCIILIFLTFFIERLDPFNSYFADYGQNNCKRWWVYGICFYFGNIAYIFRKTRVITISNIRFSVLAFCLSFILELFRLNLIYTVLAISFIYLLMGDTLKSTHKSAHSINNILLCIGTICYSIYLLHLPIKFLCASIFSNEFLLNGFCLVLIALLSCASYLYIEVPFIKFGKKITKPKSTQK